MTGTLHLLPNLLGEASDHTLFLPHTVDDVMKHLDGIIGESEKAARRYLSRFDLNGRQARNVPVALLRKNDGLPELDFLLEPMQAGENWGFVSDAGLPCIADPGAALVRQARKRQVPVNAHVGPSAITLALMLSGVPSQHFTFHGYLDKDPKARAIQVRDLQHRSQQDRSTQVAIEAPHRSQYLLETLLENLDDDCWLAVAANLTQPDEQVISRPIARWKQKKLPELHKVPAVFIWRKGK